MSTQGTYLSMKFHNSAHNYGNTATNRAPTMASDDDNLVRTLYP